MIAKNKSEFKKPDSSTFLEIYSNIVNTAKELKNNKTKNIREIFRSKRFEATNHCRDLASS